MDASRHQRLIIVIGSYGHLRQVKDEVADLPEELVLVDVPLSARAAGDVRICVDEPDTLEGIAALDGRRVQGVPDKLRIIQLDDGRADLVRPRREVDDGALREGVATL